MTGELRGVLGERDKHTLRHVFGLMRIADHPPRGGINEINVTAHQLGEGRFGTAAGVILQELLVGLRVHS